MKLLRLLPIFLCLSISLFGQKITLKGTVVDTLDQPLAGATIMLLQAQDSVLAKFGISDGQGQFSLEKISPDDYILQITYLGYANHSQLLGLSAQKTDFDLENIQLLPENAVLNTVEIKAEHIPIRFKKDTIEYNAAAFQTRPNADVEALLKKLPGVEVERDGTIKAQGETVQNVLVEGKEFFGNDPKIATKNLPADAVDKVQVFDKKSDIAEFSGIDDGREAKTINLELKDGKKKGYFGNITGGYGTEDRYEGKFNINKFGKNIQASAIGMLNNTNQQGFSFNDYINLMGGLNNLLSGNGGRIELRLDSDELGLPIDGGQQNYGFTNTGAGGLNINWELNKKTKLNASYFYSNIERIYDRIETRQSLLASQSYRSDRISETKQNTEGHRLNINLESKIDSFQTIKWRSSLGYNDKNGYNNSLSQTYNLSEILENEGNRNYQSTGNNLSLNSSLIYLRRFRKKGRFFTTDLSLSKRDNQQNGHLHSVNQFFLNALFSDTLQQRQNQSDDQLDYGIRVSYTEPLGKRKYLEANYSHQNYSNELVKDFFDIIENREQLNTLLSDHFQRDYIYDKAGFNFKMNRKKWNLTAGISGQNSSLKGVLINREIPINRNFFNLLPTLDFNYDLSAGKTLRFNYRTSVRAPSLEQLQPIVDNSDPLNVYVGNPDLQPEYRHNLQLNFNLFDQFSSIGIFANLDANIIRNRIINARNIDDLFRQTIEPVNVDHDFRLRSWLSFGAPIKFIKSRLNINANFNYHRGNYLVNDITDISKSLISTLDIYVNNRNTDIIDILIGTKLTQNRVKYEIDNALNQTYIDQIYYADLSLNLGKTWTINSSMDYTRYSAESFGSARAIPIWKASISKFILKNQRGQIKLAAMDLLNKNLGVNRFSQLNFIQEERIASLGRYFLLSFSYSLSGFNGRGEGGIHFVRRR